MGKIEAIIFDLDGTLWNSENEVCMAWNQVVSRYPQVRQELITKEELSSCFGLPMTEIAKKLFPKADDKTQQEIMDECCKVENEYLSEHGAVLYPKLEETLMELKKDYKLLVVSNCQSGYIESFIKAHKLSHCFDDIECWGNNLLPKGENNKLIMKRNNITNAVYVGDTTGDEQSARVAGIPFIFAEYGFGEAVTPDYRIKEFSELVEVMRTL